jgi:type IV pilus assembly protein PilC
MPTFHCRIGTADGRVVEREFEASSQKALQQNLEDQGFFVFKINRRLGQLLPNRQALRGGLNGRRFLSFNQELLVLLRSGLPILQVLDTIIERLESGTLLQALLEIRDEVKGGSSLSDAFNRFPGLFPHLYIASLRAGERTGDLPVIITRFIAYQKRVEAIKNKVRSASFYPMILTVAVSVVLLFLMLHVVPTFTQIYADARIELPLSTRILISGSKGLTGGLPIWLPAVLVATLVGRIVLRTEKGVLLLDRLKLILPFFGRLLTDYSLSSFCRTFGTTLASGIPAVQAMRMSQGTLNNRLLEQALGRAVKQVEEGTCLSEALEQTGFFPIIALRMIGVGESTGALSEMLEEVADYYEGEVERSLDRLTTIIEPLMMVVMGLLIGGIVVAMYIPIFQLAGTVG